MVTIVWIRDFGRQVQPKALKKSKTTVSQDLAGFSMRVAKVLIGTPHEEGLSQFGKIWTNLGDF